MVLFKVLVDQRKVSALILVMQRQRIVLVCFTMEIIVICMLARQKSITLRQIKKVNFLSQFCLRRVSNKFNYFESEEL